MKGICRSLSFAALIVILQLTSSKTSDAALSIEYLIPDQTPTESIYYDQGIDAYLHGTNLSVTGVKGVDTAANAGVTLPISNGTLSFQTGAFTGKTVGPSGVVWNFGSPGEITLKGGITTLGMPDTGTIISGHFTSATLTQLPLGSYQFDIFTATFDGVESQNIKKYFGIPDDSPLADALNFSFIGAANNCGGFTSTNFTGGVMVDTPLTTPIPAALWLMGSGLLTLTGLRRCMNRDIPDL